MLVGGTDASKRLAIHQRHYETSLAAVIRAVPGNRLVDWGSRLEEAARQFVVGIRQRVPCMAEYGAAFPDFLRSWPAIAGLDYVPEFADLDWHLGRLAVWRCDGSRTRAPRNDGPGGTPRQSVTLQQGSHYVSAEWPVDTLIALYSRMPPASWTLTHEPVHVQARGSRGSLRFSRLGAGDATFRTALRGAHARGCGHAR